MLVLGLPEWQFAHYFSILASLLLAITGFAGFVMTGMLLDLNGNSLVVFAWATSGVGVFSAVVDFAIVNSLYCLNQPDQTQSYNMKYTKKKLTIVGGGAVNLGLVMILAIGISAADSIAAGTKHTPVHPGGTKFIAIICVFAKAIAIAVDIHLLIGKSKRYRRFEMLLQEEQDADYQDEPLECLTANSADVPGHSTVDSGIADV